MRGITTASIFSVNINSSLFFLKQKDIKTYGGVEDQLHAFLNSPLDTHSNQFHEK
jgi:hypothetical protein